MKKFQVNAEFVKQAHAAACSDWKKKIEAEFPDLFPSVYRFGIDPYTLTTRPNGPIMLADCVLEGKYKGKALLVNAGWKAEIIEEKGEQLIQFIPKY